jgi:hypothetical protein
MATQFFAGQFQYQAALEPHMDRIYPPWGSFNEPPNGTRTIQTPFGGPVAPAL